MKEKLYDILKHANVPRSEAELAASSAMSPDELHAALDALRREGRIAVSRKGKYALPEKIGLIAGRAAFLHNGAAVFRPLDGSEQLRIDDGRLRAMPDDLILARPSLPGRCTIDSICCRARLSLSGYVRIERSKRAGRAGRSFERVRATAVPCDRRIPYGIVLEGDLSFVRNNEIALIAIDAFPEDGRPIIGHAERILGNAGSMLSRMRATAEDHGFPTEFPEDVQALAESFSREEMPGPNSSRADLRGLVCFTIDGADSKDFDDAVSVEKTAGGWKLGVHIADVSHYVRPGSAIDREALSRGTSLYLPGCTVPMLPEALSNDLCSLMPGVDRLTMSLFMEIDAEGRVCDFQLTRGMIRSRARLTYAGVNRFMEDGESLGAPEAEEALREMFRLSHVLRVRRKKGGSIDFDLPEPSFVLNEKYEPTEILCPLRGEAERMIEDFMLLANETVARLARDTMQPFMYRVHEKPDPDRIRQLESFLTQAGTPVHLGEHPHPGMLQRVLDSHAGDERIEIIRRYMLRALKRAQYSEKPLGHYALAMEDYCHFTSPIRRYPDLTVHRMLKLLLDGAAGQLSVWEKRMPGLSVDCSLREQAAVKAERTADSLMKAAYMSRHIGRKFTGTISGVTGWGAYVTLNNTVEGLVHVSDLDDYYVFDAERQILQASGAGTQLRMGMQVRVRVLSANTDSGDVNFELIRILENGGT